MNRHNDYRCDSSVNYGGGQKLNYCYMYGVLYFGLPPAKETMPMMSMMTTTTTTVMTSPPMMMMKFSGMSHSHIYTLYMYILYTSMVTIVFFPALIAGVVVSLLVVVVLFSLMGGVVAVVLSARRKMMMKASQSHSKAEDNPHDANINMYQNVESERTPAAGHSEPDYLTAADAFINPASATASSRTHMYDYANEIDQGPTDVGGGEVYEEARVEWSGGGNFKESVKGASEKEKKTKTKLAKPEDLYAEPNKAKKKDAKKVSRSDEVATPSDDLYAQPDMTKKKTQKGQQDLKQEVKLPPQAPLPYTKHKEAKHDSNGKEEDAPEPPPPYVPDEEQHCDTRDGNGPSSQERSFEYAELDWQEK